MNCKFCNNFIPDDAKVCSICGKSTDEETLVAVEETAVPAVAAETAAEAKPAKVYKKKSLKLPFIIILIAIAAFVGMYLLDPNGIPSVCAYLNANSADSAQVEESESDLPSVGSGVEDTVKDNTNKDNTNDILVTMGANGAAGLVGLAGVALLGKRVSGNSKAKKQGN